MKPIVCFDIESTGLDPVNDRIVSICLKKYSQIFSTSPDDVIVTLVNPCCPIPPDSTKIHGITDAMVNSPGVPTFEKIAQSIVDFIKDCDLAGFNVAQFDITMLWEEIYRSIGHKLDLSQTNIIDAGVIFKKKEPRTLEAGVQFYCQRQHTGAHSAEADVDATWSVLGCQVARYPDLTTLKTDELAKFSQHDPKFDLAGKLTIDEDGDPVYAFGKSKGVKVKDDTSFALWMLGKDFPTQTKHVIEAYFKKLSQPSGDQKELF